MGSPKEAYWAAILSCQKLYNCQALAIGSFKAVLSDLCALSKYIAAMKLHLLVIGYIMQTMLIKTSG